MNTKLLPILFFFATLSAMAQTKTEPSKVVIAKGFSENRIVVGSTLKPKDNAFKAIRNPSLSTSVVKEVEVAFTSLYNIQNKVVGLRIGDRKKRTLDLSSRVGVKGWETKAMGSFSRKRNSTFDLNYRFSLEDMLMNGNGHRLMLITKF